MNIFGIGPQIFFILFLALLLFGPKKMLQFAYQAGRYVAQLRAMWEQTMQTVQKEFKEAGLDLPKDVMTRRFDIGAEAMKVINQPPAAAAPPTAVPAQPLITPDALPPAGALETPAAPPAPAATEPSLNLPPEDDQSRKYDAWLPN